MSLTITPWEGLLLPSDVQANSIHIEELRAIPSKYGVDEPLLVELCAAAVMATTLGFLDLIEAKVPNAVVYPGIVSRRGAHWELTTNTIVEHVSSRNETLNRIDSYVRVARALYVPGWCLDADGELMPA